MSPVPTILAERNPAGASSAESTNAGCRESSPYWRLGIFLLFLTACFAKPLFDWGAFAASDDLFSHLLLVPFISIYFMWLARKEPGSFASQQRVAIAGVSTVVAVLSVAGYLTLSLRGVEVNHTNYLTLVMLGYTCAVIAGVLWILADRAGGAITFPLFFLLFMVPFPTFLTSAIEVFFQHTSAMAAHLMFSLAGTPFYKQDLVFHLPGLAIRVAEECSGIRSSLVLFITSLVAGQLFLRTSWRRALLTLAVIPLGIVRNGFRIFTIAMLCLHVDPSMLDSAIHRRGGPLFFVLSLGPFFALLLWLRTWESRARGHGGHRSHPIDPRTDAKS